MAVIGISMVRDEADIVARTVAHMVTQCDHVIVADNGSVDSTRDILAGLPVTVIDDSDPAYYQSQKMTALAAKAADLGAEWVVPFDADEMWFAVDGRIADVLSGLPQTWAVAAADLYDHVATGTDADDPDPVARIRWRRRDPAPLPKVACRTGADLTIGQGNHDATYSAPAATMPGVLTVRHFPYRSAEQFVTKAVNGAAAYAATDLPVTTGQHWREYGRIAADHGPEALADVFRRWFWVEDPTADQSLIFDPCPPSLS